MSVVGAVLARVPKPARTVLIRHRELLKFAFVGGTTFLIDTVIFLVLKNTVLAPKPVTAKVLSRLVATVTSYVLNREWSFRTRGGRERHHEAALFFAVSGVALVLNTIPLAVSRYVLDLQVPNVGRVVQEVADFVSAQIIGVAVAMVFRFWALKRFVFPEQGARGRGAPPPD